MYRIIDKRGSGKTSRLLLLAKEVDGVVVCMSPEKLIRQANKYGITGLKFVSYGEFMNKIKPINKPIFIDDMEALMNFITQRDYSVDLVGYTISED